MFISWPIAIFEVTLTCKIIQRLSPNVFLVPDGNEVNETPQGKPGGSDVWNCFTSRQETSTNAFGMTVRTKIAKCNTCSNEITCPRGNTSNLWGHLHKAHKKNCSMNMHLTTLSLHLQQGRAQLGRISPT